MKITKGFILSVLTILFVSSLYGQPVDLDELYRITKQSKDLQWVYLSKRGFKVTFVNEPGIDDNLAYQKQFFGNFEQVSFQNKKGIKRIVYIMNSSSHYIEIMTVILTDDNWQFVRKENTVLGESILYSNKKLKSEIELTQANVGIHKVFYITFSRVE